MGVFNKIILSDGVTVLTAVKSITFKESRNALEEIAPGCVSSAYIEGEVYGSAINALQGGDKVYYYQVNNYGVETLIGEFICEPIVKTKKSYRFVAYDNANKLNADFSNWLADHQSDFPMTVYQLTVAACTVAGVTLSDNSFPNSSKEVNAFYASGLTCRDIVSYAAEIAGKFVKCTPNGNIKFDWFRNLSGYRVYPSGGTSGSETLIAYKQDGLNYSNYVVPAVDRVAVHPSGVDDAAYIYPTSGSNNVIMHIRDNLLLTGAASSFYNAAAQTIYNAMAEIGSYRAFSASLFPKENPFRAGDIVNVTDIQGVSFTSPIMSLTTTNAVATIESTGKEIREDGSDTGKALAQLASDVVRINRLKVDWADIDQAIINTVEANKLKSSDYVAANNGIFAASGMEIDLANKTIKATDFALDSNGKAFLSAADIAGIDFSTSYIFSNNVWNPYGEESGYTMFGKISYRNLVRTAISGLNRSTVDAYFEYYNGNMMVGAAYEARASVSSFHIPLFTGTADKVAIGLKLNQGESATIATRNVVSSFPTVSVPSNAAVTFNGGISVDGTRLNSTFFNSLVKGSTLYISPSSSGTVNVGNTTRGVLFVSSIGAQKGLYIWGMSSEGIFSIKDVSTATAISITGLDGDITIENSGTAYAAYALCISF